MIDDNDWVHYAIDLILYILRGVLLVRSYWANSLELFTNVHEMVAHACSATVFYAEKSLIVIFVGHNFGAVDNDVSHRMLIIIIVLNPPIPGSR